MEKDSGKYYVTLTLQKYILKTKQKRNMSDCILHEQYF